MGLSRVRSPDGGDDDLRRDGCRSTRRSARSALRVYRPTYRSDHRRGDAFPPGSQGRSQDRWVFRRWDTGRRCDDRCCPPSLESHKISPRSGKTAGSPAASRGGTSPQADQEQCPHRPRGGRKDRRECRGSESGARPVGPCAWIQSAEQCDRRWHGHDLRKGCGATAERSAFTQGRRLHGTGCHRPDRGRAAADLCGGHGLSNARKCSLSGSPDRTGCDCGLDLPMESRAENFGKRPPCAIDARALGARESRSYLDNRWRHPARRHRRTRSPARRSSCRAVALVCSPGICHQSRSAQANVHLVDHVGCRVAHTTGVAG